MGVLNRASADTAAAAAPGTTVLESRTSGSREPEQALPQQVTPASPDGIPEVPPQVLATPAAIELIAYLREKHGPVMFHQSGGCCDGSSPMCFSLGEFLTGDSDVLLGHIAPSPPVNASSADVVVLSEAKDPRISPVPPQTVSFRPDPERAQRVEGEAEKPASAPTVSSNTPIQPAGAPFYISRPQFEYWKHTQLILDVVPGRGGMFSLENPEGLRFLIRGRIFTDAEIAALRAAGKI